MHIKALIEKAHGMAKQKGWYGMKGDEKRNIPEMLALIHSEISEALEEYREGRMKTHYRDNNSLPMVKPEGFEIEIADAVIRIADMCGHLGIDLEAAIRTKMEYNAKRPNRHGGKIA